MKSAARSTTLYQAPPARSPEGSNRHRGTERSCSVVQTDAPRPRFRARAVNTMAQFADTPLRVSASQVLVEGLVARCGLGTIVLVGSVDVELASGQQHPPCPGHQPLGYLPGRNINHVRASDPKLDAPLAASRWLWDCWDAELIGSDFSSDALTATMASACSTGQSEAAAFSFSGARRFRQP
jgi:hypothetical protein